MSTSRPWTVLSLDIAGSLGWAMAEGDKIIAWGVKDMRVKNDTMWTAGDKYARFRDWLWSWPPEIDEILYEIPGADFRNMAANKSFYAMIGLVEMYCALQRIPLRGMHNGTLKKAFAGHGQATKEDMCAIAHRLGWRGGQKGTGLDHDACDACALIVCILKERGIEVTFEQ